MSHYEDCQNECCHTWSWSSLFLEPVQWILQNIVILSTSDRFESVNSFPCPTHRVIYWWIRFFLITSSTLFWRVLERIFFTVHFRQWMIQSDYFLQEMNRLIPLVLQLCRRRFWLQIPDWIFILLLTHPETNRTCHLATLSRSAFSHQVNQIDEKVFSYGVYL